MLGEGEQGVSRSKNVRAERAGWKVDRPMLSARKLLICTMFLKSRKILRMWLSNFLKAVNHL